MNKDNINVRMKKKAGQVLVISGLVLMWLSGVETGRAVTKKNHVREQAIMTPAEFETMTEGRQKLIDTAEGVTVYLIEVNAGEIVLGVSNQTGAKIHEVSLEPCQVEEQKMELDSWLYGVEEGDYTLCQLKIRSAPEQLEGKQIEGWLNLRGPEVYAVWRVSIEEKE